MQVYLPSKAAEPHAVLRVLLPPNYPSGAGPVMELESQGVPEQQLAAAVKHMEEMYTPGEHPAVTAWVHALGPVSPLATAAAVVHKTKPADHDSSTARVSMKQDLKVLPRGIDLPP